MTMMSTRVNKPTWTDDIFNTIYLNKCRALSLKIVASQEKEDDKKNQKP